MIRKSLNPLIVSLFGTLVLWPLIFYAEGPPPGSELKYSVHGKRTDNHLLLTVEFGDIDTKAVSIYSEPSHTLLAVFIDSEFSKSKEGQYWEEDNILPYGAGAVARAIPQREESILHVPARPKADDQIDVWFTMIDHSGHTSNELQSHGVYGSGVFGFKVYKTPSGPEIVCCSSDECETEACGCDPKKHMCCVLGEPECCFIKCNIEPCDCICKWNGCYVLPGSDAPLVIIDEP